MPYVMQLLGQVLMHSAALPVCCCGWRSAVPCAMGIWCVVLAVPQWVASGVVYGTKVSHRQQLYMLNYVATGPWKAQLHMLDERADACGLHQHAVQLSPHIS